MYNLREIVFIRDEEDSEEEYKLLKIRSEATINLAIELGSRGDCDILERLRADQTTYLEQPCNPFCPPIHQEAANIIATLLGCEDNNVDLTPQHCCNLVSRLLGFYAVGPNGVPEFGWRLMPTDLLKIEAAGKICWEYPLCGELLGINFKEDLENTGLKK